MSITQIKENIKELTEKERRELVSFIVHLEQTTHSDYIDRITHKIDDRKNFVKWSSIREEFVEG